MQQLTDDQITACYELGLEDDTTHHHQATSVLSDTLTHLTESTIGATDCPPLDTSNLESFFGSLSSVSFSSVTVHNLH